MPNSAGSLRVRSHIHTTNPPSSTCVEVACGGRSTKEGLDEAYDY